MLDIGAYCEPSQKVADNLHNVFDLLDNRIGISIAAVSGEGMSDHISTHRGSFG